MTTLQQGRVEIEPLEQRLPTEPRRVGAPKFWIVVAIALLAVAGAVIGLVVLAAGEEPAPEPVPASPEAAVPQAVVSTDPDVLSCQLAAQGLLPRQVLQSTVWTTKRLVNEGLIPEAAVR